MKTADVPVLRPYDGSHLVLPEGCPKLLSSFSGDESRRVVYSFNSLGFRGEEFRPSAERHIFVSGCSLTFGLGIDYCDSWPSVFCRGYARMNNVAEGSINLCNFSTSGCSNSYIVRTLIGQCVKCPPTLAIAALTYADRTEILLRDRSYNIGQWCLRDTFAGVAEVDGHREDLRKMIRFKARAHYQFYDRLAGDQDLLKNALLLQLFFQTRKIPFLIGIFRHKSDGLPDDEVLAPWIELLDVTRVFTIPLEYAAVDQGAVPAHPGPIGSFQIAQHLLSRYTKSVQQSQP